jgi:hypothetical protein
VNFPSLAYFGDCSRLTFSNVSLKTTVSPSESLT